MMKKVNRGIFLGDLPRLLHGGFPLYRMLDLNAADGTWSGIRPDEFEIAIRIAGGNSASGDLQDGIGSALPFPHVYIKKPRSYYDSGTFAPRKAFVLIYRGADEQKFYRLGLNPDRLAWEIRLTAEIRNLIRQLKNMAASLHLPGTSDRIDMLAEQLFRELLLQNEPAGVIDPNEIRIRQAASWLSGHYMEEIDLNSFFIRFGFSRRNFYRCWGKVFRLTPKTYLRELRLEEAERLLGSHSCLVEEIAWQLHFRDVSHFIRVFREKNAVTPLQFRKRYASSTHSDPKQTASTLENSGN